MRVPAQNLSSNSVIISVQDKQKTIHIQKEGL